MPFSEQDIQDINRSILEKYEKVAKSPSGQFKYPVGRQGLDGLKYYSKYLNQLSDTVLDSYVGVGNPLSLAMPQKGERILDVGCGAGVDALLAALMVGPEGGVMGIEFSSDMLETAGRSRELSGLSNVRLIRGNVEDTHLGVEQFDRAITNGVLNLVVDKEKALANVFRALKPGGCFQIADQMLTGPAPMVAQDRVNSWFT